MVVKMGIVGCGRAARGIHHPPLSARADQFRVVACCDLYEEKAREVAELYGAEPYGDLDAFLARDDLDIVLVATKPPSTHTEVGLKAIAAGKNVLLEKPMCGSHQEGQQLIEAAEKAGTFLTVYQCRRTDPEFLCLKYVLDQGIIGDLLLFETQVAGNLIGAGWLLDWGVHLFDQVLQICGGKATEISCVCAAPDRTRPTDGAFRSVIRFDNGRGGLVSMATGSGLQHPRFAVAGTRGGFAWRFEDWEMDDDKIVTEMPAISLGREKGETKPKTITVPRTHFYQNLYEVLTGDAAPMVTPQEGLAAVDLALAAIESVEQGKAVQV